MARLSVDIGGTFTDVVLVSRDRLIGSTKVLTTPEDPSLGVEEGVRELIEHGVPDEVTDIVHGTTLIANALIERKGAKIALICTEGFKDVLTIRRELRYDLYDLFIEMPEPLVPRRRRYELDERIRADGTVDRALRRDDVMELAHTLRGERIESVAVCLLHSYRNPTHEEVIRDVLAELLPSISVTLSSDVSPEVGEYARTSTVVANAYVLPLIDHYISRLERRFEAIGLTGALRIMLSTGGGGLADPDTARRYPVRLLESGPAAGVVAATFWGDLGNAKQVMAFDMGGTTAKAALIDDGVPLVAKEFEAARVYRFTKGSGIPVRVPVIDLIEIGAGGGSIARVGPFGLPEVGPDSTGADPGPACYDRGGTLPTVTDADLLLGYLNPNFFLGGQMELKVDLAQAAMTQIADALNLSVEQAASAVHQVVNENMASAARMHSVERGADLRSCALVATGGAGPVHAWGVAKSLGITTILYPPGAGVASAFGMLAANPGFEFSRSFPSRLSETPWTDVRGMLQGLESQGRLQLEGAGVEADKLVIEIAADMRHQGQGEPITVELGNALGDDPYHELDAAFTAVYRKVYGRRPDVEAEILTWRVRVLGPAPRLDVGATVSSAADASKGPRPVWFSENQGYVDAVVFDRYLLSEGDRVVGPAVIEERESTVVIGPGGQGTMDRHGQLIVELT